MEDFWLLVLAVVLALLVFLAAPVVAIVGLNLLGLEVAHTWKTYAGVMLLFCAFGPFSGSSRCKCKSK